jgi:zinc protease
MALFIESDRMAYLMEAMSPELIDIQRAVVQNERRQNYDNRPYGLAFQTLAEEMYAADHPYSWPVIGYMDDLQAATFEDVGEFFGQYYAPNNASLVIAGDIDYDEAQELVTKWFSEIPAGESVPSLSGREVRLEGTTRVMLEDRVQLPRLYLAWVSPAAYEAGDAEMTALAQVLAGGRNSRLYRRLVYEMEIADDVSAFQRSGKLNSDFVVTATARSGYTLEELETVVLEEIERLRTEPPTPAELDRVRNQYEMAFLEQIERVDRKADQLNEYLFYVGDPGHFAEDLARFRTLTPAALRGAAARYLDPQARVILSIVPQGGAELAIPGSRLVPSENLQNSPAAR